MANYPPRGQPSRPQQQTRTAERPQQQARQADAFNRAPDQPPAVRAPLDGATSTLPPGAIKRGLDEETWNTLRNSIFPGALDDSILMAVDYCKARQLNVLKKPCHIVPMRVQQVVRTPDGSRETKWVWRDVILPGIYEYRITARRTGEYMGHSEPEFGPTFEFVPGVKVPEWVSITIYRWSPVIQEKIPYPSKVWFTEVYASKEDGSPNARWRKAPRQMTAKCAEAAGLRDAFPDELGGEPTADEMDGQHVYEGSFERVRPTTKPATERPRATKAPVRETTTGSGATNGAPAATQAQATEADAPAETSTGDAPPPADAPVDGETGEVLATPEQLVHVRKLLDKTGVTENGVCEKFDLGILEDLKFDQVAAVVAWINAAV
ncbi:MAG: phage recombination protein Bet [Steroidobacteraceae bacterium]